MLHVYMAYMPTQSHTHLQFMLIPSCWFWILLALFKYLSLFSINVNVTVKTSCVHG